MGTPLTGLSPADTRDGLLKTPDNDPLTSTLKAIGDGAGNDSGLYLSEDGVGFNEPTVLMEKTSTELNETVDFVGPIKALTPSANDTLIYIGGAWLNRTMTQLKTLLSLVKSDVGLGNVDNTSDANKPVSTATQTALNLKEDTANKDTDGTLAANSDTKYASQKATKTYADARETAAKAYADTLVVGLVDDRGNYTPSGGNYPTSGGSGSAGAIKKGDLWTVAGLGVGITATVGTKTVSDGDLIRALQDSPGATTDAHWAVTENNIGYVAENSANKSTDVNADQASNIKYPSVKSVYDWAVALFATAANLTSGLALKLSLSGGTMAGFLKFNRGTTIAAATTTDISAPTGNKVLISGSGQTITSFGALADGALIVVEFQGVNTITHNATTLVCPNGGNITTADKDTAYIRGAATGVKIEAYIPYSGLAENQANKDATGGYVGLTLFKINFKNVANTFTSFFTNSNTAARTYTYPDKDLTVAGIVDITDANLSTTDVTTNNSSTSKHGFLKKLNNDATYYMDGTGNWSIPSGGGGGGASISDAAYSGSWDGDTTNGASKNALYDKIQTIGQRTIRKSVMHFATAPDSSGNVWLEPASITQTNDRYPQYIIRFKDTSTKDSIGIRFPVPDDYVSAPKIYIYCTSSGTSGNFIITLDYNCGSATATYDPSADDENLSVTQAAPASSQLGIAPSMSLTAGNLAANDIFQGIISRNGAGSDTVAADLKVYDIVFEYRNY